MAITPTKFASRYLLTASLLASTTTLGAVLWINGQIAARYEAASGKTRALFGIIELTFAYKYFWALGALLALVLARAAARKGAARRSVAIALLLALMALASVFLRVWTLLAHRPV